MASHHRPSGRSAPLPIPIPIPIPARLQFSSFPTPSSPFPLTPSSAAASTPSKRRRNPSSFYSAAGGGATSFSSLLLVLFSLRSVYSLLPFLRSTPSSFSLFPFSFLVSFLSVILCILFRYPPEALSLIKALTFPPSLFRPLAAKSALLTLVLLLRFQSLRYCPAGAAILAELSGSLAGKTLYEHRLATTSSLSGRRILGFCCLMVAIFLLSLSWDRIGCFPISAAPQLAEGCTRVVPMLLPFAGGFIGFYESTATNWTPLRSLGRRRVRLLSLAFSTAMLLIPACISLSFTSFDNRSISFEDLGWPLVNTVVFGVVLSENFIDEKVVFSAKDFRRDFIATYFCTLLLELFYFSTLSLPGFLLCGILLWIAVHQLGSSSVSYVELGSADPSDSLQSMFMKPIRHILSERKSRKIALFLLINAAYMVVEFFAGFMSNSLGLISDACHMLFDCAALAIGLYASYISRLPANGQFNYGRGRFEVLSGYANAVFLVLVGALIVLESFERILDPQEVSTNSLLTVSIGGLLVNVIGLIFFHEEHHHAHSGTSNCSHSHSHSHEGNNHEHHHHHTHKITEARESAEHHHSMIEHKSDPVHSYHGEDQHGSNHDHENHQNNRSENNHGKSHGHRHDNHSHSHGHQHSFVPEHTNHMHSQHSHDHTEELVYDGHFCCNQDQVQGSNKLKYGADEVDISKPIIDGQFTEDHRHHHHHHVKAHEEVITSSYGSVNTCSHSDPLEESVKQGKLLHDLQMHHHIDHNMEGIFLHVLADTMGSIGVVISTLLIKYKGWNVADPACSIFISVMIISSVIPLLRNSAEVLLQRVPKARENYINLAVDKIRRMHGFQGINRMHFWSLTNTDMVGTVHLQVSAETDKASFAQTASKLLQEAGIVDLTVQVETVKH